MVVIDMKRIKKKLGIKTNKELAHILGISENSITRLCHGPSQIQLNTVAKFIEAGIQPNDLFTVV